MQISGLRIGNFLVDSLTGELLKVIEIKESGFTTSVIDRSKFPLPKGWQAKSIPLTKDWVSKFGFTDTENLGAGIELDLEYMELFVWSGLGSAYDYGYSISCEYVHQFQNIMLDLTGEKLTLTDS